MPTGDGHVEERFLGIAAAHGVDGGTIYGRINMALLIGATPIFTKGKG